MGIIRNMTKKAFKIAVIYVSKQVVSKAAGKVVEVVARRKVK